MRLRRGADEVKVIIQKGVNAKPEMSQHNGLLNDLKQGMGVGEITL